MAQSVRTSAGEGDAVSLRGTEVTFKLKSDEAEGASLTEWVAAPGFDTGLHVHQRLEETWYVLDGELEFRLGDEVFIAAAGACVFVPPQVPHAFANRSQALTKFLLMMSPPTHDRYFIELAEILGRSGQPDSEAIAALRTKYDTQQLSSLTTDAVPQPAAR
ncbi:MAG: cupin domain-containing protein [Solirubrobacterales bacterium]|nr:cupin domain-containing protein [Solirubrobacterales bacterium]